MFYLIPEIDCLDVNYAIGNHDLLSMHFFSSCIRNTGLHAVKRTLTPFTNLHTCFRSDPNILSATHLGKRIIVIWQSSWCSCAQSYTFFRKHRSNPIHSKHACGSPIQSYREPYSWQPPSAMQITDPPYRNEWGHCLHEQREDLAGSHHPKQGVMHLLVGHFTCRHLVSLSELQVELNYSSH